ncbi:condensation domain-containing protein [Streptomyces sp. DSM 40750]|uniref:condensation domain-containing protein n=1 Tax=Streptomyces sp. DSM 40750 TaxID=2801030 RepID=UPI00214CD0AE|nr:condensation domain-containing protein [Streptomyces sp. DSM 40750]UUU25946.1 condensation domain-containing protein [Streptomyces sp. DSM 40750]
MVSQGEVAADGDLLSFLQDLGRRRVRFYLEQGALKSAGTSELASHEAEFVQQHKAEIIAHLLSQAERTRGADDAGGPVPLSYQQERLWVLNEIAERSEEYNSIETFCIRGEVDLDRLCGALRRVVRENEVLRTVYRMTGDAISQVVLDTDLHIVREDAETPEEALEKALAAQLAESGRQFDLSAEIPVRCRLIIAPGDVCYVILNFHHIACDGWSMPLIWQQLSRFYDAPDAGHESSGSAYAEYARWQRRTITGDILGTLVDRWRDRLDGAPLVHGMPVDGGAPDTRGQVAGIHAQRIGGDVYDAFTKRCVAAGANEFAGLHSVLAILVAIVSGRQETVIGSPIANRELPDIQETVGFFVNMISVRGAVHEDDTFADVLAAKGAEIEFGYAFQQVPFERVVAAVTDGRNDTSPIFQIVLALQNFGAGGPALDGTRIDVLPDVQDRSRYDLEVFVQDDGSGGRELRWVYDENLFDKATIERWAGWFTQIVEIASESVEVPVADLRTALARWTPQDTADTDALDPLEDIDVLERIAAIADTDPDRVAVSDGTRQMTYGELMCRAGEIGGALTERFGPRGVFALDMERSVELVQTIVAVMSVGGSYVALDPYDSAARRAMVLGAADPRCLLTAGEHGPLDETGDLDIVDVRTLTSDSRGPRGPVSADDDLYYMFTSGSTGRPKGVRVTYRNLAAYLGGVTGRLRLRPGARYCWQSSVATDFGNTVLFGALATGGRLDVATRDDILDGAAMSTFLRRNDTDVLKITPSHLAALLETHPITDLLPRKTLVLGGEAAPPAVIRALRDIPASVAVHNHYGPSETTIGVFVADVNDPAASAALAIGRPLPGVEFTIEAADGAPVPFGAAGELVIRGAQVAAGYLGEPRDRPAAFFDTDAGRGYRTGDRVRRRNDGQLVFLGRQDDQVKIRGYRVELGEIRAALESTAGVGRAEVLIDEDAHGSARVVAFIGKDDSADGAGHEGAQTRIDAEAVVEQWREVYDFAYAERVTGDIEFNASGWISSYTGEPIPEAEMRSWLSSTLERISAVQPKSVLEIGCGLGIIAYPLSRRVDAYLACDFSSQIIAMNERNARKISTGPLSFFTCDAIDIDRYAERVREAAVDTVIINSVVQYFPGLDYLEEVLDKVLAIECVRNVFVGDVRNHDLLDEFSLSLVDAQAPDGEARPDLERLQLANAQSEQVTELLISDAYWTEFAAQRANLAGVSVLPRAGAVANELFDFRYDVILSKDPNGLHHVGSAGPVEVRDADLAETDDLWRSLATGEIGTAIVRGVRNPRTADHCDTLRTAKSSVTAGPRAAHPAEPQPPLEVLTQLHRAADAHGLRTSAHYARDDNGYVSRLDVVVFRSDRAWYADSAGLAAPSNGGRTGPLSTTPTAGQPAGALMSRVAEEVATLLPPHMRPDQLVLVPAFPLGKTGKLDRHALRLLATRQEAAGGLGELVGETESALAQILRDLLANSERINRESDFFAVGGHSLLAARYVHAVNRAFGLELRAKSVFDRPRLRDFAELVAAGRDQADPSVAPGGLPSQEKMAISPLQQRFWTIAKSSGPSTLYNTTLLLELTGPLSVSALRTAFQQVVAHHQVLRSYFEEEGDTVFIRLRDASDLTLSYMEIPGLSPERAERLLIERINRPFDLATGPLVEAALVAASPDTHYLMLCIHHIITDGAAEEILIEDLQECYAASLQGREPRWRDDGAAFFRYLSRTDWSGPESLDFWARQLDGAPMRHNLPLDGDRATQSAHDGESLRSALSVEATDSLAGLARRHRTTMFVVLNAVVGLFFSFLSGEDDLVVGAPYDCRETEADNVATGMYVNTVPFRHRIDWAQTLDSLIVAEWEYYREAFAHRHVPFDRLVEHVNPERVSGMNPILQIVLALHPEGRSVFPFHDCQARPIKAAPVESKFDLLFNSKVIDDRLTIYWEYKKSLFSAQRMEAMAELFGSFVETAVDNPAVPLGRLDLGGRAGGEPSLALMNGPAVPLTDHSYLDAFARSAAAAPQRHAVRGTFGDAVDYHTLDARSDAMAALLRDKGVRKGDLVAVCLKRSAEFLVTMLAVNKAGAAYVPMDSEYLRKNQSALLREHRIAFVVLEDDDAQAHPQAVTVIRRRDIPPTGTPAATARAELQHSDLCYVIFTSGSTGKPKGVAVTHGSVVNYLAHCAATYLDRDPQVAVLSSPQSFDATVTTTLFALTAGLTVQVVEEDEEISGLRRLLTGHQGDRLLLKLTPSHLVALSNLGVTQQPSDARHVFVIGGEDLKAAVVAPWYRAFAKSRFFNEYGPTEATVGCVVHEITDLDTRTGSVPIGTPICNTTIAVMHRDMVCVPYQRGEIVIMGAALARGYLDGDQTAAAFRPVLSMAGAVGYHTGDQASLIGEAFRYHGRSDGNIKIRGFRVSLAEIEAVIGGIDGIVDCACAISEDGQRLSAYVVPAASAPRTWENETELRNAVRQLLPRYMVPDTITLLAELPLTAHGKVDLPRLTAPRQAPAPQDDGAEQPDETLSRLTAIWRKVLGVSGELPTDSSFFSLGGNSLLVTLLLMRMNEEFDTDVTLDVLYRHATLSEQCALLTSDPVTTATHDAPPAAAPSDHGEVQLTAAQRRFYFMEKLGSGTDHAISLCFHIDEGVDVDHLRTALIALLDRHPILTSRVSQRSGLPVLTPGEATPGQDCVVVVACGDGEESMERILARRGSAVNLFNDPLCKAFIHDRQDGSADLQIIVHHIIFDDWSEKILLEDLTRLYAEVAAGKTPSSGRPVPFQQYAAGPAGDSDTVNTQWWIETLKGAPTTHNLPRTDRRTTAGEPAGVLQLVIEGETLDRLDGECRRLGVTRFNAVHSALALALSTVSSQKETIIGVPVTNRDDATYQDTIGLFMETLPLRTDVGDGDDSFSEIVQASHARFADALGRTDFCVEEVMNARAAERADNSRTLYEVMLTLHNEGGTTIDFAGIPAQRVLMPRQEAKLDLIVDVKLVGERLHTYWEYDTAVLSETTVRHLLDEFGNWLIWGLMRPDEPVRARGTLRKEL